jgi:hypothetical protein
MKEPIDGMPAEQASRRSNARMAALPFALLLLFPSFRLVRDLLNNGPETLLIVGGVVLGVAVIYAVTVLVCNRKFGRLTALAGPGGWGATCLYQGPPQAWGAILVDAAGVRLVGRSGVVANCDWRWETVRGVTLGKVPFNLRSLNGVVVHLADGSRAELLLPSGNFVGYPLARAEAAANQIRQRLEAFRAGSTFSEVRSQ